MSSSHFTFAPLDTRDHNRASFSCGEPSLDLYLEKYATQDVRRGITTCFVAADPHGTVAGYYTLSSYSISVKELPKEHAKNLPYYERIPCCLIGRLAVSVAFQGQDLGPALLSDALIRTLAVRNQSMGIYAIVVDALNEKAATFYQHFGFLTFATDSGKLFLPLKTAEKAFDMS